MNRSERASFSVLVGSSIAFACVLVLAVIERCAP